MREHPAGAHFFDWVLEGCIHSSTITAHCAQCAQYTVMGPFQTRNVIDSNSNGLKSSVKSWYFFLLSTVQFLPQWSFLSQEDAVLKQAFGFPSQEMNVRTLWNHKVRILETTLEEQGYQLPIM